MKLIFVVQKHNARHLHYDFRLQKSNALKSWAIPKEPPKQIGIKRLAIRVQDHRLGYAKFEGRIAKGLYGAGKVKIWDKGYYIPIKFGRKEIIIDLKGKKLKGTYCLIKLESKGRSDKNWLFFKMRKEVEQ